MPRIAVDNVEPDPNKTSTVVVPPAPIVAEPTLETPQAPTHVDTQTDTDMKKVSGTSSLAAFCAYPDGITFSGEEDNEEIILLLRAHIITNVRWALTTLGLVVLPIILIPLFGSFGLPVGSGTVFVVILAWYLGIFTYAFINFLYWYFNVYIVTDERVIDVDWYSVIYRKVSSAQISHIEDVSASQGGVFAGVFDYGNVNIQTAAEEENFEFTDVPHPQLVAKKIEELMQIEDTEIEHR